MSQPMIDDASAVATSLLASEANLQRLVDSFADTANKLINWRKLEITTTHGEIVTSSTCFTIVPEASLDESHPVPALSEINLALKQYLDARSKARNHGLQMSEQDWKIFQALCPDVFLVLRSTTLD